MATIDKAAIGFSIAIVAIGVGFAFVGESEQNAAMTSPVVSAPSTSQTTEKPAQQTDPFANIAEKVKESAVMDEVEDVGEEMEDVVEEVASEMGEAMEKTSEKVENVAEEMEDVGEEMEDVVEEVIPSGPQTVSVNIPTGTSVPGCEEANECFLPASITINVGDTVEWTNTDTAAHTVTSGSPAEGPSGVFDSSLILGGAQYSNTFEESGSFNYFCMVHPWMVGNVQVN
ncbi:MAG: plastocyanin/azurin family copper-binding protein [Nitrosopumilaceae archaeon]|jgi:plastocyanin